MTNSHNNGKGNGFGDGSGYGSGDGNGYGDGCGVGQIRVHTSKGEELLEQCKQTWALLEQLIGP